MNGTIKYTERGELVAEVRQKDAAFVAANSVVEVEGVTGKVKKFGQVFKGKQYLYLVNATGAIPTRTPTEYVEVIPQDDGRSEIFA